MARELAGRWLTDAWTEPRGQDDDIEEQRGLVSATKGKKPRRKSDGSPKKSPSPKKKRKKKPSPKKLLEQNAGEEEDGGEGRE